jgi:hypothetical protein
VYYESPFIIYPRQFIVIATRALVRNLRDFCEKLSENFQVVQGLLSEKLFII